MKTRPLGLSWQVAPKQLAEMMSSGNGAKATAMTQAMLKMSKLDIATLKRAFEQG